MIKRVLPFVFVLMVACGETDGERVGDSSTLQNTQEKPLKERLPQANRKAFVGPLEESYDAIAKITDENIMLTKDTTMLRSADQPVTFISFSDEGEVVKKMVLLNGHDITEKHEWYYDNKGLIMKSRHMLKNVPLGADGKKVNRLVQFYYEDTGVMLSSYQKMGYVGQGLPEKWRQHYFDPIELNLFWNKMKMVEGL